MICILHVLLLTAVSIIQTVVVTAREDVRCNCQHMLTLMKDVCSLIKASSVVILTHYLFSGERTKVDTDDKDCTIMLTDPGFICSHMLKGTISRENVHLGINIVNVENTVLSTSCLSYHEECIELYIHMQVSRLGRKLMLIPQT